ncbi:uncharacterized protein LOC115584563 isoform X3 [Xyrichtys novacula]|uniref:Uncharacterized protein LOC115584563 isoform X3 n=2 Tax=Xyrichtys novacula TaxID=13765 RepID=A0AAV1EHM0_XYRNO|nr:uncharacterized protein LOC115584563 isoform X3 [Xyrichtys novacula]
MRAIRVKYGDRQKYICYEGQLTFKCFLECVAKKFDIPTLDVKVYDDSKTEIDEKGFEFLLRSQDLGVLEICMPEKPNLDDSMSSSASCSYESFSGDNEGDSDSTIILQPSPTQRCANEDASLAQDESFEDKQEYARGITALFPYLADPRGRFGYEHFYNAGDGSGYLAQRLKSLQKEASEGQKRTGRQLLTQTGGPEGDREPFLEENWLSTDSLCSEAFRGG